MNQLDDAIRGHDSATAVSSDVHSERATRVLEDIVATSLPAPAPSNWLPSRTPRRWKRAALVLAGAAAVIAPFAVDGFDGTGRTAYASWSATPQSVLQSDIDAAAVACRHQLRGGSLDVSRAALVLAERRGDYVVLLYRTDLPDMSGSCLVHEPPGSAHPTQVESGSGGSSGPTTPALPRSYTQGTVSELHGVTVTDGAVGAGVIGVTIHAVGRTVTASVSKGRYVAWWPGRAFVTDAEGHPRFDVTYDLTLADGTVIRNASPTRPA